MNLYKIPLILLGLAAIVGCDDEETTAQAPELRTEQQHTPCGTEDLVEPTVLLTWHDVERPESVHVQPDWSVTLRITNVSPEPLVVAVKNVVYIGGRSHIEAAEPLLVAGDSEVRAVFWLDQPRTDWRAALSPGNAFAVADVKREGSSFLQERANSPVIFFHEQAGEIHVYGEQALHDRFKKGDLKNLDREAQADPGVIAIIDATAGEQIAEASEEIQP